MRYRMTTSVADVSEAAVSVEYRTAEARCPVCVMTLSLDDDRPKVGTVRWRITLGDRGLRIGTAESFECPEGHTSEEDPQLLRAFRSRRF
jgi:hypothetical protein